MHGNLEPEESVWETYTVHPEMVDVNLETEELLSVTFEDEPKVDMVFTPDESFKDNNNQDYKIALFSCYPLQ